MLDRDRIKSVMMRLMALERKAEKLAETSREIAQEAAALWEELMPETQEELDNQGKIKRPDGRLNDAGIRAVNAAFASGATVSEVARRFEITPSAASGRRKIWLASKAEGSAKSK
ncbi:hypothetical protein [Microvirga thermotolerans]|uniref:Uncharacterized protein n=1 Tax=Microvirga thermotolerans TaxID=2651334 RepID=A0A5P9JZW8_9HYPH|nr:hypothetical protein [Microvirga thermotolerans]QFU15494.1 hypothetical protein GDR74_04265 [Microvirga thermotolerans]